MQAKKLLKCGILLGFAPCAWAALPYSESPLQNESDKRYINGVPDDPIARLQHRIDSGQFKLAHDPETGYLPAVLKALKVPTSSQVLVFSKTSVQKEIISPANPRALYFDFNASVYVGYVRGGPVLELAAIDPKLGPIFYNLLQRERDRPRFVRNVGPCMECHGGKAAGHFPLLRMLSVISDAEGTPLSTDAARDTFDVTSAVDTTDTTPFVERWGGWYVTGRHGGLRHMGNITATREGNALTLNREAGANITDLSRLTDTSTLPSHHSDIVALMVIAHQIEIQNLIAHASYTTLRALEAPIQGDGNAVSTQKEIASACEPLVRALLFVGEPALRAPLSGTSGFAAEFAANGTRDKQDKKGRSLWTFDLHSRLFRYPCSYTIYSTAFDGLPAPARRYIYHRLWQILEGKLEGKERDTAFAAISAADRRAILEILLATKPAFAASRPVSPGMLQPKVKKNRFTNSLTNR